MEIRHLQYFVAVAEELHFTRAAARLQTAQPALSQQIRRLERELGALLFNRTNRNVELTHTGRVFLEHARRVLDDADRAKAAAEQAAQGQLGSLVIAFAAQSAVQMLPDLLIAYREGHPQVDLELQEMQNAEQADALMDGRIDVGLMTRRVEDAHIRAVPLQRLRLVVVLPASHRLADRPSIRFRELRSERWIHPVAHSGPLYTACAKAGFEPLVVQPAAEHATRMTLVAAGLGIAIDFESAPRLSSRHVIYRPLTHPQAAVELVAAWHVDRSSPLVDGFLDVARSLAVPDRRGGRSR